jgi:hypothetical protein
MTEKTIYTVILFGCNNASSDMWVPETHVFTNKEDAYAFYHKYVPSLNNPKEPATFHPARHDFLEAVIQKCCNNNKVPCGIKISEHRISLT